MVLLEDLGRQAQGKVKVAEWFERAAKSYLLLVKLRTLPIVVSGPHRSWKHQG